MENFTIESRYLKLCNEFRTIVRFMKTAFYRPDYHCPLIKRLGRTFASKHAAESLNDSAEFLKHSAQLLKHSAGLLRI